MTGTGPLDLVPVAMVVVDADRTVREANEPAAELFGRPVDALVGSTLDDLLHTDGAWHRSLSLPGVRRLRPRRCTARTARGDRPVEVTGVVARDAEGRPERVSLAFLEVPGGADAVEIISTVSHELRSPLTSVKGYTSLMLNRWDRLGDEQKRLMLTQVQHDADRVTRLVTELLDISRLETGRLTLRRRRVDLAELARSVVEKVRFSHPELEVSFEFPDDLPGVYADPDKLEQVLTNLVENAAKYGDPRGVRIRGTCVGDEVAVSVSDRGPGIPPEDLHRVFEKFYRRDHGRPTGTGLGLWISRGLVEAHGGRLEVTSRPGEGTTFSFQLPVGGPPG